jgi:hypothetical protein
MESASDARIAGNVAVAAPFENVGLKLSITGPFEPASPKCICEAVNASPASSPVTVILYLKVLSEYKSRLALPVSDLPAGAGFSNLVFITISQCLTTVGGGVEGVLLLLLQELIRISIARDNTIPLPAFLKAVMVIIFFDESICRSIRSFKRKGCLQTYLSSYRGLETTFFGMEMV